jgi:predicted  nucleic acid-binding Zn-ribbon protein
MANGNTEGWISKLQDALTDLKITTTSVETKLDQLKESFDTIQVSISTLTNATNDQETRIVLLESACSKIPKTINEDLALIKAQLNIYQKFLWIVTASIVGIIFKLIFSSAI